MVHGVNGECAHTHAQMLLCVSRVSKKSLFNVLCVEKCDRPMGASLGEHCYRTVVLNLCHDP